MSVEIAFLILVVAFMIVSRVLKQLAKQSGETAKPKSGWRGKLQQLLQEIQQEMAAGRQAPRTEEEAPSSGRGRWWEELMQPEKAPEQAQQRQTRPAKAGSDAPRQEGRRQAEQEKARQAEQKTAYTRPARQTDWTHARARQETGEVGMPPVVQAEAAEIRTSRISRRSLRQAVIWKEILDKPVALRDK